MTRSRIVTGARRAGRWVTGPTSWRIALAGLIVLAAVLRLPDLATRGPWDADQGHDMLVLTAFVRDGVWPLLGPPTSIGDFHHGALYYDILAPAAWLGGGDPTIVVLEIALLGIAAVGLVASLARAVGGPLAGMVAGCLMAVSATAIDESTFLWNPNLIAFTSALAVTAAWRAWTARRARWWLVAALAQAATMQSHVLGTVLLPPFVAWFAADVRRRTGAERRSMWRIGGAAVGLMLATYVPLVLSELGTGFHETRAALAFLAGGGQATTVSPITRLLFVPIRILAWPLTGLLTDALGVGIAAAIGVLVVAVWRSRAAVGGERQLVRWILATLIWGCLVLALGVSGLATVTPLPVDHYHAFLDPLVFIVVGLGVAAFVAPPVGRGGSASERRLARPIVAGVVVTALVGWNVPRWPPAVAPDGGYPAALAAASRIAATVGTRPALLVSLPSFKTPEAYLYPLRQLGVTVTDQRSGTVTDGPIVVVCDALFVPNCGGPAESALVATIAPSTSPASGPLRIADRFVAAPGRTISVYVPAAVPQ